MDEVAANLRFYGFVFLFVSAASRDGGMRRTGVTRSSSGLLVKHPQSSHGSFSETAQEITNQNDAILEKVEELR